MRVISLIRRHFDDAAFDMPILCCCAYLPPSMLLPHNRDGVGHATDDTPRHFIIFRFIALIFAITFHYAYYFTPLC